MARGHGAWRVNSFTLPPPEREIPEIMSIGNTTFAERAHAERAPDNGMIDWITTYRPIPYLIG